MRYIITDHKGENVLGGAVSEDNVYIKTYGSIEPGHIAVQDLKIGQHTRKLYALSGQKPTDYKITRIE